MSFATTGGFGLFYYPPTFAPLILPLGLLSATTAVYAWTAGLIAAFAVGTALLPVSRTVRWWIVLLAGLSWPFAYAVKLGQVGPILYLLFAIGWRWLDDPIRVGASAALGTAIKLQPAIIFVWAALTRRWLAVVVGAAVLGGPVDPRDPHRRRRRLVGLRDAGPPGRRPDHDAAQLHAGRDRLPARRLGRGRRRSSSWARRSSSSAPSSPRPDGPPRRRRTSSRSSPASSLSPVLWDHYAMILLLPVAYLCAAGRWWALLIPLVTATPLVGITPPIAYPICFFVTLGATLGVGIRAREAAAA